jgi:hypothetical protein
MKALFILLALASFQAFADSNLSGSEEFMAAGQLVKAKYTDEAWRMEGSEGVSIGEKAILIVYRFENASDEINHELSLKASDKCIELGRSLEDEVEHLRKDYDITTNRFIAETSINRMNRDMISQRCLLQFQMKVKN